MRRVEYGSGGGGGGGGGDGRQSRWDRERQGRGNNFGRSPSGGAAGYHAGGGGGGGGYHAGGGGAGGGGQHRGGAAGGAGYGGAAGYHVQRAVSAGPVAPMYPRHGGGGGGGGGGYQVEREHRPAHHQQQGHYHHHQQQQQQHHQHYRQESSSPGPRLSGSKRGREMEEGREMRSHQHFDSEGTSREVASREGDRRGYILQAASAASAASAATGGAAAGGRRPWSDDEGDSGAAAAAAGGAGGASSSSRGRDRDRDRDREDDRRRARSAAPGALAAGANRGRPGQQASSSSPSLSSPAPSTLIVPWRMSSASAFKSLPSHSPLLRLHEEILDFARFMAPFPAEQEAADRALAATIAIVGKVYPGCRVEVFGSRANGLVLPTSDWDVVIFSSADASRSSSNGRPSPSMLYRLAAELEARGVARKTEVIANARVPIVKVKEKITGITIDISFDAASGVLTRSLITDLLRRYPAARPLMLVLKYFLMQRGLNETYTGGIGSFLLVLMVVHVVQQKMLEMRVRYGLTEGWQEALLRGKKEAEESEGEGSGGSNSSSSSDDDDGEIEDEVGPISGSRKKRQAGSSSSSPPPPLPYQEINELNLGSLLLSFLELYGHNLNAGTVGISVRGFYGSYFSRSSTSFDSTFDRPGLLCVENPCETAVDVAKNSWNMARIRKAFQVAHTELSRSVRAWLEAQDAATQAQMRSTGHGSTSSSGSGSQTSKGLAAAVEKPTSLLKSVIHIDKLLLLRAEEVMGQVEKGAEAEGAAAGSGAGGSAAAGGSASAGAAAGGAEGEGSNVAAVPLTEATTAPLPFQPMEGGEQGDAEEDDDRKSTGSSDSSSSESSSSSSSSDEDSDATVIDDGQEGGKKSHQSSSSSSSSKTLAGGHKKMRMDPSTEAVAQSAAAAGGAGAATGGAGAAAASTAAASEESSSSSSSAPLGPEELEQVQLSALREVTALQKETGVALRHKRLLADLFTRKERKVEETAKAIHSWY